MLRRVVADKSLRIYTRYHKSSNLPLSHQTLGVKGTGERMPPLLRSDLVLEIRSLVYVIHFLYHGELKSFLVSDGLFLDDA